MTYLIIISSTSSQFCKLLERSYLKMIQFPRVKNLLEIICELGKMMDNLAIFSVIVFL